ncbi:two-component system, OmpR family, alkaline phosphatase synthesis response regulator PhoP [Alkalibacterium subtropicum]|uniref:Two-component system, OmpR family, alkaline phosphatase synthesis response regulator PhoP n=1 Tax=Alkalibacterium subtropicum TaxID=753702 RepID=A0A1I1LLJ0_9LACT|nr:response regulator transcription factor [Alkalibacterium subtropicum]SFC73909.1 two-component system, OmpR family, alkaline phosphatase synthesis response regulator PhoP [Alkalibacterium subtropicum]
MKKVLVVEDEQSIAKLLQYNLEKEGYEVDVAMDGKEGLDRALEDDYTIILLDLMLPTKDGMDVCRELRQEKIDTPIIMLTAKDSEIDKIVGLEIGADDYMTKPFSPREVTARIKAILRRVEKRNGEKQAEPAQQEEELTFGEITIYPNTYEVIVRGEKVDFTPKEFELLLYLAKHANRVLSRDQLLLAIWDYDFAGETRIVDVHISHLREKIEADPKKPEYIKTARGFGYKFEARP